MQPRYGFYGRLKAEFPSQLLVDVAEGCNLECIHCPHVQFKRSKHYAGRTLDVVLNEKLVEEVREHGQGYTQYIRYASNGEPLIHPGIYGMMEYAKLRSGVVITLTTNGILMTQNSIDRLLSAGVDIVDISIDAFTLETYAKIRVKGRLLTVRDNVLKLIKMVRQRGVKTKVVVSYVEQPLNQHETTDFENFWKNEGADFVVIRRRHSCSGSKVELADSQRAQNAKERRRPCLYPWERIVLNARGEIAFCPSDWVHGSYIADYSDVTIYSTWQGEFYKGLRGAHLSSNFKNYQFCGQCPDWEATRWGHEGRSYADMIEEFKER